MSLTNMPSRTREKGVQPLAGAREKRTHEAREIKPCDWGQAQAIEM